MAEPTFKETLIKQLKNFAKPAYMVECAFVSLWMINVAKLAAVDESWLMTILRVAGSIYPPLGAVLGIL